MNMKIAFLQETANQSVGVMCLSATLKNSGYGCELFAQPFENNMLRAVKSYQPDIIGFSVITGAHHWVLGMAARIKEILPGVIVILGGPHPTYFPEVIKEPCIDIIARGEAEIPLLNLARRMKEGRDYTDILGLWVKKDGQIYRNEVAPLVEDISSLPAPDHYLYLKYSFYRGQTEVPFNTTRGCPYKCSFCFNHTKAMLYRGKGTYVRMKKVNNIIMEIEMARKIYPKMKSVMFYDDTIGLDRRWLGEFCDAYTKAIGMPWFTSIRADLVDESLIEQLSRANCFCLSLGVESGDEEIRSLVLYKKISDAQYIKAARLIRNAGIKIRTSNMFFLPGENINKAFKTVDLNRNMKVDFPWAYTLQPYPGTDIYNFAVKNGYLSSSFQFDEIDPLGLLKPIFQVKDQRKIMVLHRLFYLSVRNRPMRRLLNMLIFFPPNPIFDAAHCASLILSYAGYHQVSLGRAILVAWTNYWELRKKRKAAKIGQLV